MQLNRYFLIILLVSCFNIPLQAQWLEGIWSGKISRTANSYAGTESLEMQLFQTGKKISGRTFAFKDTSRFVLYWAVGLRNKKEKTLILEERGTPYYILPPGYFPCEKVFSLNYYKIGKTEYLIGKWTGVGVGMDTSCFPGEDLLVVLQKQKKPDYPLEQYVARRVLTYFNRRHKLPNQQNANMPLDTPPISEEANAIAQQTIADKPNPLPVAEPVPAIPVLTNTSPTPVANAPVTRNTPVAELPTVVAPTSAATVPAERRQEIQQILRVQDTVLTITLYDNAIIDDDTITLFINKKAVLVKQRISHQPLVLHVPVAPVPGQPIEILMQAENLGSIPPNTALMIVESGKRRYEVWLSAGYEKHAVVIITYDP